MVNSIGSPALQLQPVRDANAASAAQGSQPSQAPTQVREITDPRERANVHGYMREIFAHHKKRASHGAGADEVRAVDTHNARIRALACYRQSRIDPVAETLLTQAPNLGNITSAGFSPISDGSVWHRPLGQFGASANTPRFPSTLAQPIAPAIRLALSPARFVTYEAAATAGY